MRLNSWFRLALFAGAAFSLTACSYFSGLFPDKQKQYRYSSELPDLEVPPDLLGSAVLKDQPADAPARYSAYPETEGKPAAAEPETPPTAKRHKPVKHDDSSMTLAQSGDDDSALIEVSEPYAEAWNDVSRALGRMRVEITDQNRSDGVFYVYYGGEAPKKPEDLNFWDEMKQVLNMSQEEAKEYRVNLQDKGPVTFVRVLDEDGKGVSKGAGLELLKRIHKKLTTLDQPEPVGEEAKKAEEAEKKETEKPAADENK